MHIARTRRIAAATATLAAALALSACSGSSSEDKAAAPTPASSQSTQGPQDGQESAMAEYVAKVASVGDALHVITIDGSSITYDETYCDGTPRGDDEKSVGELDTSGTSVVWTDPGYYHGSDQLVFTGDSVAIGGKLTLSKRDSGPGKAQIAQACNN